VARLHPSVPPPTGTPALDRPATTPVLAGVALPRVVAHRGYSSAAPENTLAAMAAGTGADLVEIDVDLSGDGVPFVLHDATLDRTTDGTGALRDRDAAYVDALDAGSWFSPAFAGQRVPRLTAALALAAAHGSRLLLEVKRPQSRTAMARVVREIREAGMLGRTVLQSFDEDTLRHARAVAPELRLAALRRTLDADPVAVARDLDVVAYNPDWDALREAPQAVDALHAAGVAVIPWTVDDPAQWAAMRGAGVDGIITNRAAELAREQAPAPTVPQIAATAAQSSGEPQRLAVAA
jgi:glycerophosphoryl diester phosphodiesterase